MTAEPIQEAINGLLAEAATATAKLEWATVASLADAVLKLDPKNADALTFKSLAADGTVKFSDKRTLEQEIQEARRVRAWENRGGTTRRQSRISKLSTVRRCKACDHPCPTYKCSNCGQINPNPTFWIGMLLALAFVGIPMFAFGKFLGYW